ncbi:hypothetical protein LEMA_P121090.1 [Plenodomus lingam JN3]|uniref:Uncharacterized protein n=1 Tax=Leptosphaeria maculans (strain JN3 / isolate v23.1.3 / race Av1-4-5-6-7-8) TaxID=985895 RepID=E4ZSG5_LEPMJ|nr:hypothetical protein LEMA_P121090.1 [Plenodomus lingam JN3]CBX94345.1 hypothetical protein LEMA_P121090.1 [Plenodomus lingam JN3]
MLERALLPALFSLLLLVSGGSALPYASPDNSRDSTPSAQNRQIAPSQATSKRTVLPYQIGGVVGAYVLTVFIWGVLLLTVGRKMRRKALEPPKELELELQDKPPRMNGLASPPLSARSATSWLKKFKRNDSGVGSTPQSPIVSSPTSFDQTVIDAQRDQAQAEMERLYAAVMDHDAKKHNSQSSVEALEVPIVREPQGRERRRPSAISVARSQDDTPASPVKAIYPPDYKNGPSTAPLPRDRIRSGEQHPPPSPRSILSKRSQQSASNSTNGSKSARFNLKNLRISGPIQKYPGEASDDEARRPLSPRFYQPGAPPSPPTQTNSPTSPYDPTEELDQVQPLPRPAPQRLADPSIQPGISITRSSSSPSSSPNHSLPLRSFATPLASPGIQTTVLDRRVDQLTLGTPKTGVPFTPYSPYMPFTPITPVTPSHLVSKRDRKAIAKMEGRRAKKEELVQSPKEIFGDAY